MLRKYIFSGFFVSALFLSPLVIQNSFAMGRSCQRDGNTDFISTMKENFKNMNWNAKITGVITTVLGTNLTVMVDDKIYQIDTRETMFRRRFGAQSTVSELITVGDKVNVVGNWVNDEQTAIKAVYIRDITMEKRIHKIVN